MTTTVEGFVSVKSIAKTFAAGKTAERHLYQKLGELGLPNGRVSTKWDWYTYIGNNKHIWLVHNQKSSNHNLLLSGWFDRSWSLYIRNFSSNLQRHMP